VHSSTFFFFGRKAHRRHGIAGGRRDSGEPKEAIVGEVFLNLPINGEFVAVITLPTVKISSLALK
jgi:hypothetical protein